MGMSTEYLGNTYGYSTRKEAETAMADLEAELNSLTGAIKTVKGK